jgi:ribosomal protein S12 methylthiotransferase
MRGRLVSRPAHAVMREAEKAGGGGGAELLVISQDTSAYGVDLKHAEAKGHRAHITDLARDLGTLGAWVRLHYVYPYPHVRELIPLMAEGLVLPYLDIPFQHAHPDTLRRMARPAAAAKTLDEIAALARGLPRPHLRSTFIVGYPGETEAEFQHCSTGWTRRSSIGWAASNTRTSGARGRTRCPTMCPRRSRRSAGNGSWNGAGDLRGEACRQGRQRLEVIVDEVDEDGATCRTKADAPEIDGNLFIDEGTRGCAPATS